MKVGSGESNCYMDKGRTEVEAAKRTRIQESLLGARSLGRKRSMLKWVSSKLRSHGILDVSVNSLESLSAFDNTTTSFESGFNVS